MKKILAIAVATAISAPAMADMTIGATYAFGYTNVEYDVPAAAADDSGSGFGTDTAAINVSASTEVNGYTVTGKISAGGLTRGSAVTGENAELTVSGDFGKVQAGEYELGSGIRALGTAGAPVNNMEGEILGAAANKAMVKYTAPAMGPVTLSVNMAQTLGMGTGDDTASTGVAAAISMGAVSAKVDYTSWQDNVTTADDRIRAAVKVDLGSFAIGAGVDNTDAPNGGTTEYTVAGVNYIVSDATSVGVAYAKKETKASSGAATTSVDGYTVGFTTALSSNVSLNGNFSEWETSATADANKTNLIVSYSF